MTGGTLVQPVSVLTQGSWHSASASCTDQKTMCSAGARLCWDRTQDPVSRNRSWWLSGWEPMGHYALWVCCFSVLVGQACTGMVLTEKAVEVTFFNSGVGRPFCVFQLTRWKGTPGNAWPLRSLSIFALTKKKKTRRFNLGVTLARTEAKC